MGFPDHRAEIEPEALEVSVAATDRRVILPSELVIQISSLSVVQSEDLSDQVSALVEEMLCRGPWRQTYVEQQRGPGSEILKLSRWPIEGEKSTDAGRAEDPPAVEIVGGSAVALDSYRVVGENRRELFRDALWLHPGQAPPRVHYEATYTAGYLMPGQLGHINIVPAPDHHVKVWQTARAYAVDESHAYGDASGGWVLPTAPNGAVFEVTVAGTTGGSEPAWDAAIGATTADGTVTWTAHPDYLVMPERARQAVLALAHKVDASNRGVACPAGCGEAEEMVRKAFGGAC